MTTIARFAVVTLLVIAFVLIVMLAQGIGESFGNGITELVGR
jgi:hypothetical protein